MARGLCCPERGTIMVRPPRCNHIQQLQRLVEAPAGCSGRGAAHLLVSCATNDATGRRNYRSRTKEKYPNRQWPQQLKETDRKDGLELSPGYRRMCGMCIVNRDGLVFVARKLDDNVGSWQMPQGGIEPEEEPDVAAARAMRQETGIISARKLACLDRWLTYEFPTTVRQHARPGWIQYKGQIQMWYLMHFYGLDSEVNLALHARGEREFSDWTWMPFSHLPYEVVPFKRRIYEEVATEFAPIVEQAKENFKYF